MKFAFKTNSLTNIIGQNVFWPQDKDLPNPANESLYTLIIVIRSWLTINKIVFFIFSKKNISGIIRIIQFLLSQKSYQIRKVLSETDHMKMDLVRCLSIRSNLFFFFDFWKLYSLYSIGYTVYAIWYRLYPNGNWWFLRQMVYKSSSFNNIFRHIANATIWSILFCTYSLPRRFFEAPKMGFQRR